MDFLALAHEVCFLEPDDATRKEKNARFHLVPGTVQRNWAHHVTYPHDLSQDSKCWQLPASLRRRMPFCLFMPSSHSADRQASRHQQARRKVRSRCARKIRKARLAAASA
jgi:hypothetical protein